jgi:dihydropyrimidinase
MRVKGWPVTTLSRGEVVWQDGEVMGQPGRGRFLKRAMSSAVSAMGN